jgi:hypothetical protein
MAKRLKMPDCLSKRDLLYAPSEENIDKGAYGDLFFQENLLHDALMFYHKADDGKKIGLVREHALREGDFSLLAKVDILLVNQFLPLQRLEMRPPEGARLPAQVMEGFKLSPDEWRTAAGAAFDNGKERYAADMFERSGDADRATELRAKFAPPAEESIGNEDGSHL